MKNIEEIKAEYKLAEKAHDCETNPCMEKQCKLYDKYCGHYVEFLDEYRLALIREMDISRLEAICNAEREGRYKILSVKEGTLVYRVGYIKCQDCPHYDHLGLDFNEMPVNGCDYDCPDCVVSEPFRIDMIDDFGKDYFSTPEEVEAIIKESEGND